MAVKTAREVTAHKLSLRGVYESFWSPRGEGGGWLDKPEMMVSHSWPTLSNGAGRSRSTYWGCRNQTLPWDSWPGRASINNYAAPWCLLHPFLSLPPRAGSGLVRIDPLRFLAGCRTRWLNQALSVSVLSLSLGFVSVSVVLLTRATFCGVILCYLCVLSLVRLSVPVQVIDWKDSSPKWPIMCWWGR